MVTKQREFLSDLQFWKEDYKGEILEKRWVTELSLLYWLHTNIDAEQ